MTQAPTVEVEVYVDLTAGTTRAGTAYLTTKRGTLTTTFMYDTSYMSRSDAWELGPDLPLAAGRGVVDGLPGAMADSAPERWGRNLIKKQILAESREQSETTHAATEVDYLLGVSDFTRQGAIRYCVHGGEFLEAGGTVPALLELPLLLNAAEIVSRDTKSIDEMAAIKALLAAGTGSLGGARPKASVRDEDRLLIAKFPHASDEWDVMAWEMAMLDLAEVCGIRTPNRQLVDVTGKHVLLLERFDREDGRRVPYVSAMTLMQAGDGEHHDYLELAEALQEYGSAVKRDLHELWRRIAFSIAINNTDDHLRNHGFLLQGGGWGLSPVFDVNPNPNLGEERTTSINSATRSENALVALKEVATRFDLDSGSAEKIWREVLAGLENWEEVASFHGIGGHELDLFADSISFHI